MNKSRFFLLGFLLTALLHSLTPLQAQDYSWEEFEPDQLAQENCEGFFPFHIFPNKFFLGPEIYYVRRERAGGTRQSGGIYGVKAGYERIKRKCFYLGAEVLYGTGHL